MRLGSDVVHSDPEIVSGAPAFVGTRVPVRTLIDHLAAGNPRCIGAASLPPGGHRPPDAGVSVGDVRIGPLGAGEIATVAGVLARGMRDNPVHVAVFGGPPARRQQRLDDLYRDVIPTLDRQPQMLVARAADGTIVGVCGMMPPGRCRPSVGQSLRLLPTLLRLGPAALARAARWFAVWAAHHPGEPHWHLGPVAVDAHLQGRGIGSRLLAAFCARVDAAGDDAYLETDKPINVRFYERFGFAVVGEQAVLGTPTWFMHRRASVSSHSPDSASAAASTTSVGGSAIPSRFPRTRSADSG